MSNMEIEKAKLSSSPSPQCSKFKLSQVKQALARAQVVS